MLNSLQISSVDWWIEFVTNIAQPFLIAMIWGLIHTWKKTSKQSAEAFEKAQESFEKVVEMKDVLIELRSSLEELSHTINYVSKQIDRQDYRLESLEKANEKLIKVSQDHDSLIHSIDIRVSVLEQQ